MRLDETDKLQSGVNYIATVLKRNKTLKVLNLSENRIDYHGLLSLSEALKHNHTLETLDLSKNPCCGPESEGVSSTISLFIHSLEIDNIIEDILHCKFEHETAVFSRHTDAIRGCDCPS